MSLLITATARFSETGDNYDYSDKNLEIKNTLKPVPATFAWEVNSGSINSISGVVTVITAKSLRPEKQMIICINRSLSSGLGFREQNINIDFGFTNLSNESELYSL